MKTKEKEKQKRKRQTSVITIGLWLFLIATMVTIVTSNAINKEADEIESDDWKVSLVMYEDVGTDAKTDVTWNATKNTDKKQVTMQINYACTTGKEYAPGEIEITVNGISKDSWSEYWRNGGSSSATTYEYWLANNVVIAADKSTATTKQYDWSYSYDSTTNIYTFTNNNIMVANEHFEGTIQIAYNLEPEFKIQTDLTFQAKMKENITDAETAIAMTSNTCNIHYTGTKMTYSLQKRTFTGDKAKNSEFEKIADILDDYYWVKYSFKITNIDDGIIYAYDENNKRILYDGGVTTNQPCIKDTLPEGCVLYDNDLNKVEPKEGTTYYYLVPYNYFTSDNYYYIGYPKSKYNEGDKITNIAELWGRYEFKLPKYDNLGDEIEYSVDEKDTPKYYEKKIEGTTVINTCTYTPPVDTGDINVFMYICIFLVAIIGIFGILIVRNNKVNKNNSKSNSTKIEQNK